MSQTASKSSGNFPIAPFFNEFHTIPCVSDFFKFTLSIKLVDFIC